MKKKIDKFDLIIVGVMIASLVISLQYYFNMNNNNCISNPLAYSIKYYEERYGEKFGGSLTMMRKGGNPYTIYFDNNNTSISYDKDNQILHTKNLQYLPS